MDPEVRARLERLRGALTASAVTVTDTLPGSVTFVSASPGCTNVGGVVTCHVGALAGGGGSNLTVTVTPSSPGPITNRVSVGSTTADPNSANNAATNVITINAPPVITGQPTGQVAIAGANVSFSATASGSPAPAYQWFFTNLLAGRTASTLTLSNVQPAQAGGYTVVASNIAGVVTSSVATLTVIVPPLITAQPATQTVLPGTNVTFQVAASGTAPLRYQWTFRGTNLAAGTTNSLLLSNVQMPQAGGYAVVVTNHVANPSAT